MKRDSAKSAVLSRALKYVGRYKAYLWVSLFLSAVSVAATLYIPILTGQVIDLLIGQGAVKFSAMVPLLVRIGILIALGAAAQFFTGTCNNRLTYCTVRDIRNDAFRHLQRLPISYLDSHASGDVVSRVITDVDQFADGLLMGFTQLFTGILTILGTLGFMYSVNWIIATAVVVITPLSLVAASFIAKNTYKMFSLQTKIRGEQTSLIDEMLTQQKVVRAFGMEQPVQTHFDEINGRLRGASLRAVFFSSLTNPSTRFVNSLVYACVGVAGALTSIATGGVGLSIGSAVRFPELRQPVHQTIQ